MSVLLLAPLATRVDEEERGVPRRPQGRADYGHVLGVASADLARRVYGAPGGSIGGADDAFALRRLAEEHRTGIMSAVF